MSTYNVTATYARRGTKRRGDLWSDAETTGQLPTFAVFADSQRTAELHACEVLARGRENVAVWTTGPEALGSKRVPEGWTHIYACVVEMGTDR